jgi:hypothetical protein
VGLRRGATHSQETIATVNGTPLSWSKRHGCFNAAKRAFDCNLDTLSREGLTERLHIGGDALILLQLARLAALWIVSQSFISKELLLSGTEDELLATVYAP